MVPGQKVKDKWRNGLVWGAWRLGIVYIQYFRVHQG